jgi:hypothetical protein
MSEPAVPAQRTVRIETVQKIASRLRQRNEQIIRARILHTNALADGLCPTCHVANCPTFLTLQDPPPVHAWMPETVVQP